MTLPLPSEMTAAVGQILTAAAWNSNVRDGINYLLNPPIFTGYQVTVQSIPDTTRTAITFDAETVDTYGGHSTTTNNSRYTAQVAGWYLVVGQVVIGGVSAGIRIVEIYVNGAALNPEQMTEGPPNGSTRWIGQAVGLVFLNVGDYVETRTTQTSGAPVSTAASQSCMTALWVHA